MEFFYEVKIPKERIAVVIGTKGETRRKIEKKLEVMLEIDSQDGDVGIQGEDSLQCIQALNIIKAIGRGFAPKTALLLLKDEYAFELIDITDYVSSKKNHQQRIKARVIGSDGKARKHLERATNTKMVIFGKTVGIIGKHEDVQLARRAVEGLLSGNQHKTVYMWIDMQKKKQMQR